MPTSTTELQAKITVNDGPELSGVLVIDQHSETIRSDIATRPDQRWEYIDQADHFHSYDQDGKLPTLTSRPRHIDCDGSCDGACGGEGYDVTEYFCAICDEQIEPGRVDDRGPRDIPTRRDWYVKVRSNAPITGDLVTVRADVGMAVMFGLAKVGGYEGTYCYDHAEVTTTLYSASPLGTRDGVRSDQRG